MFVRFFVLLVAALAEFELLEAFVADQLTFEEVHITRVIAENASRVILLQNDLVAFRKDFERVLDGDVHRFAQLDRDHDAPQIVQLPDDSGRFHLGRPPTD